MITMKKKVMKTGMSLGVIFTKPEREVYNIEEGDVIDIGDIVVTKKKGGKRK